MGGNLFWVFVVAVAIGGMLIAFGGKKQEGAKDWPQAVQWGYLAVLIGGFGLLSNYMSFTAVMLVFVLITGAVWLADKLVLAKRRVAETQAGHFVDYSRGFFPVILVVFLLRSFIAEPFQIPSSSMRPGLVVGDFILVNKFTYGLRVPVLNTVFAPVDKVERGDVVVFNFPPNPKVNYIKRAIGLPGDVVEYRDKRLTVNGKPLPDADDGSYEYLEQGLMMVNAKRYKETMGQRTYSVLNNEGSPTVALSQVQDFPFRDNCRYDDNGFVCKVPAGYYFMLGDNRDNSLDGRYWGFVDDKLVVGKAFMIWMNFGDLSRIGKTIH
ncbi:signal peptidase I [Chromobacterium alkanivorans]|uniref:signal peptidase I n=1 Tax=Chromobacterium alkanivorans TaxID=1071719 RepID=UPI002168DBDD|nr:signal peptidase I [Chromobacterium alkanivorans]MCS3820860.1 signal peptidase I [Chromobacterium alkanivorans]MCS3875782.1 signal peptidase I [Chromobacterium alkanivorans]